MPFVLAIHRGGSHFRSRDLSDHDFHSEVHSSLTLKDPSRGFRLEPEKARELFVESKRDDPQWRAYFSGGAWPLSLPDWFRTYLSLPTAETLAELAAREQYPPHEIAELLETHSAALLSVSLERAVHQAVCEFVGREGLPRLCLRVVLRVQEISQYGRETARKRRDRDLERGWLRLEVACLLARMSASLGLGTGCIREAAREIFRHAARFPTSWSISDYIQFEAAACRQLNTYGHESHLSACLGAVQFLNQFGSRDCLESTAYLMVRTVEIVARIAENGACDDTLSELDAVVDALRSRPGAEPIGNNVPAAYLPTVFLQINGGRPCSQVEEAFERSLNYLSRATRNCQDLTRLLHASRFGTFDEFEMAEAAMAASEADLPRYLCCFDAPLFATCKFKTRLQIREPLGRGVHRRLCEAREAIQYAVASAS